MALAIVPSFLEQACVVGLILACALGVGSGTSLAQEHQPRDLGKRIYVKANCVGCHKWHGDGGGGYGGAALSLRTTAADREQLIEVVRCGRPTTGMPFHDERAYGEHECYGGITAKELGKDMPPPATNFLRASEIEAVVDYVLTTIKGKGEPALADCLAFWGAESKMCNSFRPAAARDTLPTPSTTR